MKIAMILRPDAEKVFGGDTVVMQKLSVALRGLGAEVTVGQAGVMPPARDFDLLHIFTVAPIEHSTAMVRWAQQGRAGIVFSPLYYNDFRDWFERAAVNAPRWRSLAQRLGRRRAWGIYRAWQTVRLPAQRSWKASRAALLAADCIATTSHWENAWVAGHFRLPARTTMAIGPLGIDAALYGQTHQPEAIDDFRRRYRLPEEYVAQVARIEEKKNQLGLLQALRDDETPLVFVGKVSPYYAPDYADRCRALAAERGNVTFIGWLPEEELPLLYAGAAAHVLPSWVELPGLSSLEAGASGTRVISTRVSPLPELLGDQAWYCDPNDTASIRDAVRAALKAPVPPGLRRRLLDEFSWEAAARANLSLYERVLESRRAGEPRKSPG